MYWKKRVQHTLDGEFLILIAKQCFRRELTKMAHLHCRGQTQIQNPNPMVALYCAEHVHTAQTQTRIPTPYFCTGQDSKSVSESESVPESVSGNVNEP